MARKTMYSFEEKHQSANGKAATALGAASLVFLLAMVYASYYTRGHAGLYAGAFGVCGLVLGFAGFVLGIYSFSEKNCKHTYPKIGSVLSGVAFVCWLGLYLIGI